MKWYSEEEEIRTDGLCRADVRNRDRSRHCWPYQLRSPSFPGTTAGLACSWERHEEVLRSHRRRQAQDFASFCADRVLRSEARILRNREALTCQRNRYNLCCSQRGLHRSNLAAQHQRLAPSVTKDALRTTSSKNLRFGPSPPPLRRRLLRATSISSSPPLVVASLPSGLRQIARYTLPNFPLPINALDTRESSLGGMYLREYSKRDE